MIGFNHALAGGLIGYLLPLPVAAPLAVVSHFALDALPHYGLPYHERDISKLWKPLFMADFAATASLAIIPVMTHQYAILLCGLLAVLPDFVWVKHVVKHRTFNFGEHTGWYRKWHAGIQRFERPWGVWVELLLAIPLFYILLRISF